MTGDESSFLLPPPPPPETKTRARVILVLSALGHLALFVAFAWGPAESPPPAAAAETVRVLRGEVVLGEAGQSGDTPPPGLRLLGYGSGTMSSGRRRH
jgi:hypothetical protein